MARNAQELEDLSAFVPGKMYPSSPSSLSSPSPRVGRWAVMEMLDEGGFGRVFRVQNTLKPSELAALKIESTRMDGGSAIKLEKAALEQIHGNGTRPHVPALYRSARRKNICYMVVTLLGDNLKRLKDRYFENGMSLRTLVRVAIQCLYAIKVVHDSGFVHRDIKAGNFVLGRQSDLPRARIVHIIDFGLARQYTFYRNGRWCPRKPRANVDFRGTVSYAAPSMHDGAEQGRKDDLWSFLYLLIDLYAGLPWSSGIGADKVGTMKQNIRDEDLLCRMPSELLCIPRHLRSLSYHSRPDYSLVFSALIAIKKRVSVSFMDSYEWETPEQAEMNRTVLAKILPGYLQAAPFFSYDPFSAPLSDPSEAKKRDYSVDDEIEETKVDGTAEESVKKVMRVPALCTSPLGPAATPPETPSRSPMIRPSKEKRAIGKTPKRY